jgi:hypothetical protein
VTHTANGLTILTATVTLPRTGVWHADVATTVAEPSALTGPVVLSLGEGALTLRGTPIRPAQVWRGQLRARLAGGAAGFGTILKPQGFRYTTGRIVALDILSGAGEQLSSTADSAALATIYPTYTRLAGPADAALGILAARLDIAWRVLPDGSTWLGRESWPASALTDDQVLASHPEDGRCLLGVELPTALPGTTFVGQRIGRVVHHLTADKIRTELFFDNG